ncbi:MAG TPA: DUF2059 domain-containing protein [Longimicrobiaceae bacterium]|jgi:hypothetical protein|nr:DUF2059 domain-containing protein [Longimicrobiaceae bacterium]
MIRRFLLLFSLLGIAAPVAAQDPTPGQLRAAERLVTVMQLESNWGPVAEQMRRYMRQAVPDTGRLSTAAAREYQEKMDRQLQEMFTVTMSWKRVQPEYVKLYASLYTDEELRQLTAFYESPLGQKTIRIQPEVAARTFAMVQRLMAQPAPR